MPVKLEKKLGRDRKFYNVLTEGELRNLLSIQSQVMSDIALGTGFIQAGETGLGLTIGVTAENLTGETYTDFDAELYRPMETGLDYLIYDTTTRNIYSIISTADVQTGEVNIPIQEAVIKAPIGSLILEQSAQTMEEQRDFRERIDSLNTNLADLNDNVLPELETNLTTLEGYLEDPSTIPDDWSFFEGILTNDIWADTGVFMTAWADNVFANTVMADRITANILDVYDVASVLLTSQFIKANEIALVGELPAADDPDDIFKGGLIRSSTFDGTISASNQITSVGTSGWAIDYSGESVFNNATVRGTVIVGSGSNVYQKTEVPLVIRQSTEPTQRPDGTSLQDDDVWIDTDDGKIYVYDSSIPDFVETYNALSEAQAYTDNLETYVDGAFEDSVVSQAEGKAIERHINELNASKARIDEKYNRIYNNSDLTGTPKTSLDSAKTTFNTEHNDLITAINNAISDGEITSAERTSVNTAFDDYEVALASLQDAFEDATNAISQKKADDALNSAQAYTDQLETYVDGAFEDSVISQAEGKAIERHLKELESKDAEIDRRYSEIYNNGDLSGTPKTNLSSAKSTYDTEYSDLVNEINSAISDGEITSTERTNVNTAFDNYASALDTLSRRFEEAIDAISQKKADDAENNANSYSDAEIAANNDDFAQDLGYTDFADLESEALSGNTIIDGGSIRTSLIQVDNLLAQNINWTGRLQNTIGGVDIILAGEDVNSLREEHGQILIGNSGTGSASRPKVEARADSNNYVELVGRESTDSNTELITAFSGGNKVFFVDKNGASYGGTGSVFEDVTINGTLTMGSTGEITDNSNFYIDADGFKVGPQGTFNIKSAYMISGSSTNYGAFWGGTSTTTLESLSTNTLLLQSNVQVDIKAGGGDVVFDDCDEVIVKSPIRLQPLTTTQMNAISTPVQGMIIFNTTIDRVCYYRQSDNSWRRLTESSV